MVDYYEKHLSHPTEFKERMCDVCRMKFTPLYFDNDTCHMCVEKRLKDNQPVALDEDSD